METSYSIAVRVSPLSMVLMLQGLQGYYNDILETEKGMSVKHARGTYTCIRAEVEDINSS
jgi:hypothetical protein